MNTITSRTLIQISGCLTLAALFLTSCQKDDDLARPQFDSHAELIMPENPDILVRNAGQADVLHNQVIVTVQRKSDVFDPAEPEAYDEDVDPHKILPHGPSIHANAEGGGWSEVHGRVITELKLVYHPDNGKSRAMIKLTNEDGITRTIELLGEALVKGTNLIDETPTTLIMRAGIHFEHPEKPVVTAYLEGVDQLLDPGVQAFNAQLTIVGPFNFPH